jgi:cytochrome c peroxidase
MAIAEGDRLPQATLVRMGESGPEQVDTSALFSGRKVALFAVPGAYTSTCHTKHVPSIIEAMGALKAKGVDEIICLSVNDIFVMKAWGDATGATEAGITMIADADASFTKAIGLDFSVPHIGLLDRSQRYSMLVDDGVVKKLNVEEAAGVIEKSSGPALATQI